MSSPHSMEPPFLDDANGIVVLDARERQLGNDDLDGLLVLACPPVVDGLDVTLAGASFATDDQMCSMRSRTPMTSSSVDQDDSMSKEMNSLRCRPCRAFRHGRRGRSQRRVPAAHAQLLEQLRRLVQESRCVEVGHREQIRSAFGGRGHDFRGVGFDESLRDEVFATVLEDLCTQAEHGVDVGLLRSRKRLSSRVSKPTPTVSVTPSGSGASASATTEIELASTSYAGRGVLHPSLVFGGRFWSHRAGHGQRAFTGQALEETELILAERVGFGKNLGHARTVAEVSEADGALAPAGMQKPGNSDFLADKLAPLRWISPSVWVR